MRWSEEQGASIEQVQKLVGVEGTGSTNEEALASVLVLSGAQDIVERDRVTIGGNTWVVFALVPPPASSYLVVREVLIYRPQILVEQN